MSREPSCPPFSCPSIDRLINAISEDRYAVGLAEDLRSVNSSLRSWGEWWKEKAEEIESQKDEEIKALLKEIDELKNG